jgi:mannitol/fructose-specific phosphotransferase system IIA component (Ntr-type)
MRLRDFFTPGAIKLDLQSTAKDSVLAEMVGLLGMDARSGDALLRVLLRRESLGSTGMGRGIAIPHGRSLVANRLRLAYGRSRTGVDYQAIDGNPVHHFFLIIAPPLEISNQYLPVLGRVAQLAKDADVPETLSALERPEDFLRLLEERGV